MNAEVSTALSVVPRAPLVPGQLAGPIAGLTVRNLDDVLTIAKVMAASGLFEDARDANRAAVKILAGLEVGIGPFAAMNGYHLIQNKAVPSAGILAGLLKRHPVYDYEVLEHSAERCVLRFTRHDAELGVSGFTMDDARTQGALSGRNQGTWQKFPRNMLFARAMTNGVKWFCPDLTLQDLTFSEEEYDQASGYEVRQEAQPPRPHLELTKARGGDDDHADGEFWRRRFFGLIKDTPLEDDAARHKWLQDLVNEPSLAVLLARPETTNAVMAGVIAELAKTTGKSASGPLPSYEDITRGWFDDEPARDVGRVDRTRQPAAGDDRIEVGQGECAQCGALALLASDGEALVCVDERACQARRDEARAVREAGASTETEHDAFAELEAERHRFDEIDAWVLEQQRSIAMMPDRLEPAGELLHRQAGEAILVAVEGDVDAAHVIVSVLTGGRTDDLRQTGKGECAEIVRIARVEGERWRGRCEEIIASWRTMIETEQN